MTASSYPRHDTDSAAIFLRELALHLARQGVEVTVLAPADPATRAAEVQDGGVTVQRFAYPAWGQARLAYGAGILPNLAARPILLTQVPGFVVAQGWALRRAIRDFRPDLVHAHWVLPQGLLAAALTRLPVVVSAHGGDAWALRGRLLGAAKRWTLRTASAWTANTAATAAACASAAVPPPQVIPMGVDAAAFAAGNGLALKAQCGETRRVVLFVGRLVAKKGVSVLLAAWAQLGPGGRAGRVLWLVGEGTQRRALEQQASAAGLGDSVRFFGRVPNARLPDYYAAAELCAVPSVVDASGDTEGQGVVILEAMAAGRAVIASRTGGIAEVLTDGETGTLVPPADVQALAEALRSGLDNALRSRQLGAGGQDRARKLYDWPRIAARFRALYGELLARRRSA